jgi:CheY-like chemotaxis protein
MPPPTTLQRLVVLVVDDDPTVRWLYCDVLRQAGATVTSSAAATEVVEIIDVLPPDVVITDLCMPGHDGIWLLRELKARMPQVPVILVSGHVEPSRDQLLALGFAEVLSKPLPLAHLVTVVARVGGSTKLPSGPSAL